MTLQTPSASLSKHHYATVGATEIRRLCDKPVEKLQHRRWLAWLQATAAKYIRTALFRAITQRVVVIPYRRFGTTCRWGIAGVYPVGMCHLYWFAMSSLSIFVAYIDLSTFCRMLPINPILSSVSTAVAYRVYRLLCPYRFVCSCYLLINKFPWCELKSGWTICKCWAVTGHFTVPPFDLLQPAIRTWRPRELWGEGGTRPTNFGGPEVT